MNCSFGSATALSLSDLRLGALLPSFIQWTESSSRACFSGLLGGCQEDASLSLMGVHLSSVPGLVGEADRSQLCSQAS